MQMFEATNAKQSPSFLPVISTLQRWLSSQHMPPTHWSLPAFHFDSLLTCEMHEVK